MKQGRHTLRKILTGTLLATVGMSIARAQQTSGEAGLQDLKAALTGVRHSEKLTAQFECQKRILSVKDPLISLGEMYVAKDERGHLSMRLSMKVPYVSDIILADGKTRVRSQHEAAWTTSNQSSRPGHTAVLGMIGEWSLGEIGKTPDYFTVRKLDNGTNKQGAVTFVLETSNKDLAASVRKVILVFAASRLAGVTVETAAGDVTEYRFTEQKDLPSIPPDIFKPVADAGEAGAR